MRPAQTRKRITRYVSFKGSKREAQVKLAELIAAVAKGSHVDHTKMAVAEFVRSRVDQWEASQPGPRRGIDSWLRTRLCPTLELECCRSCGHSTSRNGTRRCAPKAAPMAVAALRRAQSVTPTECCRKRLTMPPKTISCRAMWWRPNPHRRCPMRRW